MAKFTSNTGAGEPALIGGSEGDGIIGETTGVQSTSGVVGVSSNENGVGVGVKGTAEGFGAGVVGLSKRDCGVFGTHGDPHLEEWIAGLPDATNAGVFGASEEGPGVFGYSRTGDSGWFKGNVRIDNNLVVNGDIFVPGADCAELFPSMDQIEPGDVVVLDRDGALRRSDTPYDKRVAGVVSGAGRFRPGVILDSRSTGSAYSAPLALIGKVYCKVDARAYPVEVGDLLTTSATPGHAMKANPFDAAGTVLGKALADLDTGTGLLPILVCLQ
ncbi:hypothetical protein ACIRRA_34030 [Nocardia sp. NPDC101769]|uniref:hypothetical protein n=1 Tax=Nocardia sp. NPDC101769 TaxID=3364333 RepID=UPI0037FD0E0F